MNLSFKLPKSQTQFSPQQIQLRWAIITVGVIVNAAILWPTFNQVNPAQETSVTYLPPSAFTIPNSSANPLSSKATPVNAKSRIAQADTLAQAGQRDEAVEQYLKAMTEYVQLNSR